MNTSDILFQKPTETSAHNAMVEWQIGCTSFPFQLIGNIKDLSNRDFANEDGEDTYFPLKLTQKAFDIDLELAYKGSIGEICANLTSFIQYLTGTDTDEGSGTELCIYDNNSGKGYAGCYLKSSSDDDFNKSNCDEVMPFKLTFRVTKPSSVVQLNNNSIITD
jgi:hypothetical protein